ncbi:MAG: hypothetical protein ACFFCW_28310 [Candidatus Hodarchaeota archaeon]
MRFRQYIVDKRLYGRWGYSALEHRCRQLFARVGGLAGRSLLEIGSGEALFSLWALAHGAERVILLEPEANGAKHGMGKRFIRHRQALCISEDHIVFIPRPCRNMMGRVGLSTWCFHITQLTIWMNLHVLSSTNRQMRELLTRDY